MRPSVLLALICAAFLTLFAQNRSGITQTKTNRPTSETEQIMQIERRWAKAEDAYDPKVLNDVLAEDFVSMNEVGEVKNKTQEIASDADWKAPSPEVIDDVSIRINGNTAVALGRFTYTDRESGRVVRQGRFLDTLVRHDGRWQVNTNSYVRTDVSCR